MGTRESYRIFSSLITSRLTNMRAFFTQSTARMRTALDRYAARDEGWAAPAGTQRGVGSPALTRGSRSHEQHAHTSKALARRGRGRPQRAAPSSLSTQSRAGTGDQRSPRPGLVYSGLAAVLPATEEGRQQRAGQVMPHGENGGRERGLRSGGEVGLRQRRGQRRVLHANLDCGCARPCPSLGRRVRPGSRRGSRAGCGR